MYKSVVVCVIISTVIIVVFLYNDTQVLGNQGVNIAKLIPAPSTDYLDGLVRNIINIVRRREPQFGLQFTLSYNISTDIKVGHSLIYFQQSVFKMAKCLYYSYL